MPGFAIMWSSRGRRISGSTWPCMAVLGCVSCSRGSGAPGMQSLCFRRARKAKESGRGMRRRSWIRPRKVRCWKSKVREM